MTPATVIPARTGRSPPCGSNKAPVRTQAPKKNFHCIVRPRCWGAAALELTKVEWGCWSAETDHVGLGRPGAREAGLESQNRVRLRLRLGPTRTHIVAKRDDAQYWRNEQRISRQSRLVVGLDPVL